jgi:tRNA threonylcarbamoyl adenosine modification protein (Sua5/YciO/YrdC/YwlC family)
MQRMKMLMNLNEAAEALKTAGSVGVLPTDTVYGLAARAADRKAVERLYALKHREHKPGTVIAASVEQLVELGIKARNLRRVAHLWPNPVSVVVSAGDELDYLHQELDSLAVRVPNDEVLNELLESTGPLVTSSANRPGEPGATKLAEARGYFGGRVDFYVDGGDLSGRAPSTIVRLAGSKLEVLRQGALEIDPGGMHLIAASREGCPFCRANGLLKGPVLGASDGAYMIEAISNPGYYLLIPETHVESLAELTDTWWGEVKELLAEVPVKLADYNMAVNIGRESGQTVGHVHFWVIPREGGKPSSGKGFARLIDLVDGKA